MATPPPDRWQLVQEYLDRALAIPPTELLGWLASLRASDRALAEEIEGLLDEHRAVQREHFLEESVPELASPSGLPGETVGAYRILSSIADGGMGSVWLAERADGRFARRTAVKLPRVSLTAGGVERFKREGEMLARLTHPHIAQLIDAGVSSAGRPYLVLEHVDGVQIDRYCDERRLTVDARVRLFLDVLEAVAHAHANLVVHRDIKPSNVFVTTDGQVKLLDFGVAKMLEDQGLAAGATQLTRDAGSGLTLEYAAPEQVTGAPISIATDVYGLGVLFFVLLTGQHPAGRGPHSHASLVRAIVERDAPRPSDVVVQPGDSAAVLDADNRGTTPGRLRRTLRGDLDTIAGTALRKVPADRFASVGAFADDLRRYLALEPIRARPQRLAYRAAKFARRNRLAVALALVAAIAAVAGLAGTVSEARRAQAQRDFAFYELSRAEAINDLDAFLLSDATPSGTPIDVSQLLARAEHIVGRQRSDPASRVDLLVAIGRQYLKLDQDGAAGRVLKEAYRLSRGVSEPSVRARAACALGAVLARGPEGARGEALYADGMARLPDDPRFARDRVFCLQCGSLIARERGAVREAIARVQTAMRLLEAVPFEAGVLSLRLSMDLAESYRVAGRQREAAAAFKEASARLTAAGRDDTETAGTLFNNWAMALFQLGQSLDSERIFRRAIDISGQNATGSVVSPMLMINYARVLSDLGRNAEAADYAERGHAKAEQAGVQVVVNQSLLLRASIYRQMHDLARSAAMLETVEPRLRDALPPGHIAFASLRSQQALLAYDAGDMPGALALANQAVAIATAAVASGGQGADMLPILLTRRSQIEAQLHRLREAETDARQAIGLLDAALDPAVPSAFAGRARLALGNALCLETRTKDARPELLLAVQQLQNALGAEHLETRSARLLLARTN